LQLTYWYDDANDDMNKANIDNDRAISWADAMAIHNAIHQKRVGNIIKCSFIDVCCFTVTVAVLIIVIIIIMTDDDDNDDDK
jgi:hypothetical protein